MSSLPDIKPLEQVDASSGCWVYTGKLTAKGYARQRVNGKPQLLHRAVYAALVGDPGPELDHKCRNRACCNPLHLEPVDHLTNVRRGLGGSNMRDKTHCPAGHPYDDTNTKLFVTPRGGFGRQCKACARG